MFWWPCKGWVWLGFWNAPDRWGERGNERGTGLGLVPTSQAPAHRVGTWETACPCLQLAFTVSESDTQKVGKQRTRAPRIGSFSGIPGQNACIVSIVPCFHLWYLDQVRTTLQTGSHSLVHQNGLICQCTKAAASSEDAAPSWQDGCRRSPLLRDALDGVGTCTFQCRQGSTRKLALLGNLSSKRSVKEATPFLLFSHLPSHTHYLLAPNSFRQNRGRCWQKWHPLCSPRHSREGPVRDLTAYLPTLHNNPRDPERPNLEASRADAGASRVSKMGAMTGLQ